MQIEQSASLDRMGMRRAGKLEEMEGRCVWKCTLALDTKWRMTQGARICALVILMLCVSYGSAQDLNPRGRNVCKAQGSLGFVCCPGWKQQGEECLVAICEGNFTCKENEVCVRPNECRCRHGYFGANCETKCPRQFWGPDCKEKCACHPNGHCDDVIGQCTCNANRWGPNCENACLCKHGKCDQETGRCTCEPNWWGPQCSNACYCSTNSQCDQTTGRCICQPGWWARSCNNQCSCNNSPCEQLTGRCQCRERLWGVRCERICQCFKGKCNQADGTCTCEPGYRGKFCREPCPAGLYGQGCRRRCGQCKEQQPCTVADGRCIACEAGWNGTKCDQVCSHGFYGEACEKVCPPCKDGHTCNHINGKCTHCNAGWIGDRCETKCRNGTYGENCAFVCSDCFNGECHFETGKCLCSAGSYGPYCNMTCPPGQYGINCEQYCSCRDDKCDPVSGACHMESNQRMGVIGAGILVTFLLILLSLLLCCCCICRKKEESTEGNQEVNKKPPRRFCGRFSRISMKLPRIPLRRQKLPKVVDFQSSLEMGSEVTPVSTLSHPLPTTLDMLRQILLTTRGEDMRTWKSRGLSLAHHDMENTFNCSFIEPPSAAEQPSPSWSSRGSFSSFDTTDDGPVYCIPHEDSVTDCKDKANSSAIEKMTPPINEDEAGEYTYLKESGSPKSFQADNSEAPLLKSSDSERSSCGSGSTGGALYAKVARLSKQSKDEDDTPMDNKSATIGGKPPSPERTKPPPPDPSTKPKVSWIHGKYNANQSNSLPVFNKSSDKTVSEHAEQNSGLKDHHRKRTPSDTSPAGQGKNEEKVIMRNKDKGQKHTSNPESRPTEEPQSPSKSKHKNKRNHDHIENINGTVQNALKKIGNLHIDKKGADVKEVPKSPDHSKSRSEVFHPHLSSEAASLLAAQLKEKTQSLNRIETSSNQNGIGPLKAQKEKPTPPQKAKRSVAAINQKSSKPVLPTTTNLQKMISPVSETIPNTAHPIEKQNSNNSQEPAASAKQETGEPAVKKTPIKKPPRKKSKDATLDSDGKTQPKMAIMPPQSVK